MSCAGGYEVDFDEVHLLIEESERPGKPQGNSFNDIGNGQFKVSLPLGPGKEWLRMVMKR